MLQTQISMAILQTDAISTNKQLINAVTQLSYKCTKTSELNFFHGCTCVNTMLKCFAVECVTAYTDH